MQPSLGSTLGGSVITLTGVGFSSQAAVSIGGSPAAVTSVTSTSIVATAPPHAAGTADIVVSSGTSTGALNGAFRFVAPVTGANDPPKIAALTARGRRPNQPQAMADLAEAIDVAAVVTDAETPLADLVYEWTSSAGAVEGTGSTVSWRAPSTLAAAQPLDVLISFTVIERYVTIEFGAPQTRENRSTASVTVRVHDSGREIADLAYDFLRKFSEPSVPPSAVIADFSSSCGGRDAELQDTIGGRCEYTITSYAIGPPTSPTMTFAGVCDSPHGPVSADACTVVPVHWDNIVNAEARSCGRPGSASLVPGQRGSSEGFDYVSALYDAGAWKLCTSTYRQTAGGPRPFKK